MAENEQEIITATYYVPDELIEKNEIYQQIQIFQDKKDKNSELLIQSIKRVFKLRQIRIEESKILEKKSKIWSKIWLTNSISLIIISLFEFTISKIFNIEKYSLDVLTIYTICYTIIVLVMTYYVQNSNLEKKIVLKHHEQSTYRNIITEAVQNKILYNLNNKRIYEKFIDKRDTITQFNDNHSRLAYLITTYKNEKNENKKVEFYKEINKEYKNEFSSIIGFYMLVFLFNVAFIAIEIVKNYILGWHLISITIIGIYTLTGIINLILIIQSWIKFKYSDYKLKG